MSDDKRKSFFNISFKILAPLLLVAAGGAAWAYFQATAPTIKKHKPRPQSVVVDVKEVHPGRAQTVINAMGTVIPSREVTLKSKVSGEVIALSDQFLPGGRIPRGEKLVTLDPADYEIAVKKAQSALDKALADLAIEKGSQTIAREELRLMSKVSSGKIKKTDLALRKPQLQQAQASVDSARADLEQTKLDLERTIIAAPFNALITQRSVNLGSQVSSQESLATIVSTDEFWVEALVPLNQLSSLDLQREGGCPAVIRSQSSDQSWSGQVLRITGQLSDTSRMAPVIIAVPDPIGSRPLDPSRQLMLDDYVEVEISGRTIPDLIELPRSALQDDNTVWIYADGVLEIRPVTLAWKNTDRVFVKSGLTPGDRVVVTELSRPVPGMALTLAGNEERETALDKGSRTE